MGGKIKIMPRLVFHDPNIRISQPKSLITALPVDIRPYEFKTRQTKRLEGTFQRPTSPPEEILSGYVHGKRASALEERYAKALEFYELEFSFRYEVPSIYSLPGEGKELDFVVWAGGLGIPVEVGASFVHDSPSKKEEERRREAIINDILPLIGISRINEETRIPFDRPYDFEDAKALVSQMFIMFVGA
jgi:hypothetical protein